MSGIFSHFIAISTFLVHFYQFGSSAPRAFWNDLVNSMKLNHIKQTIKENGAQSKIFYILSSKETLCR